VPTINKNKTRKLFFIFGFPIGLIQHTSARHRAIETIRRPRTATRPLARPPRHSTPHIDEETTRRPLHRAALRAPHTSTPPSAAIPRYTGRPGPAARDKSD